MTSNGHFSDLKTRIRWWSFLEIKTTCPGCSKKVTITFGSLILPINEDKGKRCTHCGSSYGLHTTKGTAVERATAAADFFVQPSSSMVETIITTSKGNFFLLCIIKPCNS